MQNDLQMDIIAEYYMGLRDYTPSEKYSDHYSRVYTLPDSDAWLFWIVKKRIPYRQELPMRPA